MNIFVDGRQGTPITEEERRWIENEIAQLTADRVDYALLDREVMSCHDMGLTSFDRSVLVQCIDADIEGMQRTLCIGYVICW